MIAHDFKFHAQPGPWPKLAHILVCCCWLQQDLLFLLNQMPSFISVAELRTRFLTEACQRQLISPCGEYYTNLKRLLYIALHGRPPPQIPPTPLPVVPSPYTAPPNTASPNTAAHIQVPNKGFVGYNIYDSQYR